MSNAAIYLHPDAYDTRRERLLGRHSAGESFLRGFLRHADVERFNFWVAAGEPGELDAIVQRLYPPPRPVAWYTDHQRRRLKDPGVLYLPGPGLRTEAWAREPHGERAYSLCGLTHAIATARTMDSLAELLLSPVEDHDALICTSKAVRDSVESLLDGVRAYLAETFGPRRRAEPQRVTIPLGVNVDDFAPKPEDRAAWRTRLGIAPDDFVALYVGRLHYYEKMSPAPMALALERAARETGRPVHWVNAGWAPNERDEQIHHEGARALCPTVAYHVVDGRPADTRFSIWSVADAFISFSDNIQESFGLTPVEAMAAGLPCVVTDWDGYRDTVRHGEDGFLVPTYAPPPGYGADLAYSHALEILGYGGYVGAASQFVAVDLAAAQAALSALITNPDLRARLGRQARARAEATFDWSAIIPQYQALWAEQTARRTASPGRPPRAANPFRPDPFALFAGYPSRHMAGDWRVFPTTGVGVAEGLAVLALPLARHSFVNRMSPEESAGVIQLAAETPGLTVEALCANFPAERRGYVSRSLLWAARYGVITLAPP